MLLINYHVAINIKFELQQLPALVTSYKNKTCCSGIQTHNQLVRKRTLKHFRPVWLMIEGSLTNYVVMGWNPVAVP